MFCSDVVTRYIKQIQTVCSGKALSSRRGRAVEPQSRVVEVVDFFLFFVSKVVLLTDAHLWIASSQRTDGVPRNFCKDFQWRPQLFCMKSLISLFISLHEISSSNLFMSLLSWQVQQFFCALRLCCGWISKERQACKDCNLDMAGLSGPRH